MLSTLALYLSMAISGILISAFLIKSEKVFSYISSIQLLAIIILIFTVASRIGFDREMIKALPSMGLSALALCLFSCTGSMIFLTLGRRIAGFDRNGHRNAVNVHRNAVNGAAVPCESHKGRDAMTIPESCEEDEKDFDITLVVILSVISGIAAGMFFIPPGFIEVSGTITTAGLCVLLLTAGIDIGRHKTLIYEIKRNGLLILTFPALVYAGTFAGAAAAGLFLDYSIMECITAASGMGWYTLTPLLVAEKSVELSTVTFLTNMFREILSMILIPAVAKHIGKIEVCAPGGATTMDTCLPVIQRSAGSTAAIYSFISGIVLSSAVPIITPMLVTLL